MGILRDVDGRKQCILRGVIIRNWGSRVSCLFFGGVRIISNQGWPSSGISRTASGRGSASCERAGGSSWALKPPRGEYLDSSGPHRKLIFRIVRCVKNLCEESCREDKVKTEFLMVENPNDEGGGISGDKNLRRQNDPERIRRSKTTLHELLFFF